MFLGFFYLKLYRLKFLFSQNYMKRILVLSIFSLLGCAKHQTVHPPVGGVLGEKDLNISKNRAKNLNILERSQIEEWIKNQDKKFYPMGLNYWMDIENLERNPKKTDGEKISYRYDIYDFDKVKLYDKPKENHNVTLGKFEEIKAVEDALKYLRTDEEATLLVPSVLAFGTYGDNDKIPNDMPVIIKLKVLEH